jgi:hypothetical protein
VQISSFGKLAGNPFFARENRLIVEEQNTNGEGGCLIICLNSLIMEVTLGWNRIRAFIFDMDGTIIDNMMVHHLAWQQLEYGDTGSGAVCMRKHLLWYAKGWPAGKTLREAISQTGKISDCLQLVRDFASDLRASGVMERAQVWPSDQNNRFQWDPKFDMDRQLDRGVGDDGLQILGDSILNVPSQIDVKLSSVGSVL